MKKLLAIALLVSATPAAAQLASKDGRYVKPPAPANFGPMPSCPPDWKWIWPAKKCMWIPDKGPPPQTVYYVEDRFSEPFSSARKSGWICTNPATGMAYIPHQGDGYVYCGDDPVVAADDKYERIFFAMMVVGLIMLAISAVMELVARSGDRVSDIGGETDA